MTIHVTQDDIDNGVACNTGLCPIAHAIRRAVPGSYWYVGSVEVFHRDLNGCRCDEMDLPVPACEFISAFDEGRPVNPFSFELEID